MPEQEAASIQQIWRYPLKSAQGERLDSVHIAAAGPEGDRGWACISEEGLVVSAKNPRRWGKLLQVGCGLVGSSLMLRVPGSPPVTAGTVEADAALSRWLGQPVHATTTVPANARLERTWPGEAGMIPDWAAAAAPGAEAITPVPGARPGGRFVDFGALHIITTAELDRLSGQTPDADVRRFRPNLVIDGVGELQPGDVLRVGPEVVLRCLARTPRCAIPGAAQAGLAASPDVLRALGRERVEMPGRGRAAVFGIYAEVLTAGNVAVGDSVTSS